LDGHRVYASIAQSHREPERNNFTDNGSYPAPRAEELTDVELGYTYNTNDLRFGVNFYYMDYTDQFVQTGLLSDIGENLTTNIDDSYRLGVELKAGIDVTPWLSVDYNTALSRNRIRDFDEVVEDWDNGSQTIHYGSSTLAFSPSVISNAFVNLHHRGWQATWHTGYVSRQYLDNTECTERSLPAYQVSNLSVSYSTPLKSLKIKEAIFGLNLNNVFNRRYAASGWVYSAICESGGHTNDNRYYQIGFIPMAGFTMMGNVTLRF
jgi:iron complex outermembrane receptor protein